MAQTTAALQSFAIAAPSYEPEVGIGQYATALASELSTLGHDVSRAELIFRDPGTSLVSFYPAYLWDRRASRTVLGVVTEHDVPLMWRAGLTQARHIFVPSEAVLTSLRGITDTPASVVHFGIDAAYQPVARKRKATLRVLVAGYDLGDTNAGADIAAAAFREAFGDREDVELIARSACGSTFTVADGRVRYDSGRRTHEQLAMFYASCDVLVHASRGESNPGVALAAMATGMPVIFARASGAADLGKLGFGVNAHPTRAAFDSPLGSSFEPDASAIVDRLCEIDLNYDAAMKRAASDAKTVRSRWSWAAFAQAIIAEAS